MLKIYVSKTANFDPSPWFPQSIKFSVLISLNLFVRFPSAGLQASCQFAHSHFPLCPRLFPMAGKEVVSIWQVRPCVVVLQVTELKKYLPYNSLHARVRGIQRDRNTAAFWNPWVNSRPSVKTVLPTEHCHRLTDASFAREARWRARAWERFLGGKGFQVNLWIRVTTFTIQMRQAGWCLTEGKGIEKCQEAETTQS